MSDVSVCGVNSTLEQYDLDGLMEKAKKYLHEVKWDSMGTENGVEVFRAVRPITSDKNELKWPCYKTRSVFTCSLSKLYDSLSNFEDIKKYSEWAAERSEVEKIDENTTITWSKSKSILNMKPHDFSTLSHTLRVDNSTIMMMFQSVNHPNVPLHKDYSRSRIVFSLNLLLDKTPDKNWDNVSNRTHLQTELVTVNHVCYTGLLPLLVSGRAFQGIVDYMTSLGRYVNESVLQL